MGLRSFFAVLPPQLHYSGASSPIESLPVPPEVRVLRPDKTALDLSVRVGDDVKTGQDLARFGRGPIVSTATGRIREIGRFVGPDQKGYLTVTIAARENDIFAPDLPSIEDTAKAEPLELRTALTRAGFDIFQSVSEDLSKWPAVKTLIISALDRDPFSTSNRQVFRESGKAVEAAVELLLRSTGASACILAVPQDLMPVSTAPGPAVLQAVPPVYPNGLPEILARRFGKGILMRRTPAGLIGDTLVISIEHAAGMVEALKNGRPLYEKTLTFSAQGKVRNLRVRIGTPVGFILEKAGVGLKAAGKLILDGPMKGYACYSDQQPVTAHTESLHVQGPEEVHLFQNSSCLNCGRCNAICPVDLEVNLLGRCSEYSFFDRCKALGVENCIECGLCAYVCPARRPLVQYIVHARRRLRSEAFPQAEPERTTALQRSAHKLRAVKVQYDEPSQDKEPERAKA